ncbi:MAG: hypothetical protein OEV52_05095 [Dehalococcoidia bacterium]|nr:hypothetical protein [Dehalococcoidia bacterium]
MWLSTSHARLYFFPWAAAFLMLCPTCNTISIEGIQTGLLSDSSCLSLRGTRFLAYASEQAPQSLIPGKAFYPATGSMGDDEAQMPNERDAVIVRAYTQVLCDKGICSPGLSDMGMYHRMFVY